jgi:hypothetical protein
VGLELGTHPTTSGGATSTQVYWTTTFGGRSLCTTAPRSRISFACRALFDEVADQVVAQDDWFRQKRDAAGLDGLSSRQKICSALRQLTSGVSSAELNDKCASYDPQPLQARVTLGRLMEGGVPVGVLGREGDICKCCEMA